MNSLRLVSGAHQHYLLLLEQLAGEQMEAEHKSAFPRDTQR